MSSFFELEYSLKGQAVITINDEDIEKVESLVSKVSNGSAPKWLMRKIIDGIDFGEIEVEDIRLTDSDFPSERELCFDVD